MGIHINHRWKNVKAGHYEETTWRKGLGRHVTVILQRCEVCGAVRTEQIDGLWDLEDLDRGQ